MWLNTYCIHDTTRNDTRMSKFRCIINVLVPLTIIIIRYENKKRLISCPKYILRKTDQLLPYA